MCRRVESDDALRIFAFGIGTFGRGKTVTCHAPTLLLSGGPLSWRVFSAPAQISAEAAWTRGGRERASRTRDAMDRVNVAHLHVRAEGNILRRALPAAEYADILHFEVCWLDGMAGDRVVPFLHLLGRGNVYLAITTANAHFVAMRGVEPTVATLPLSQIDGVEGKGPVPARFFHSHIHGEPDAMRVAKRFEIRARRRRPARAC